MSIKKWRLMAWVVSFLACACSTVDCQTVTNNARTILTEMLAKYENADSYQDNAELRVFPRSRSPLEGRRAAQKDRLVVSFKTYFRRPEMFRFDWHDSSTKASRDSAIWFDGEQGYSWTLDKFFGKDRFILERKSPLNSLIRDTINPSGGMTQIIPGLLMSTLEPYTFADVIRDFSETKIIRKERLDGEMCYVIKSTASNVPWILWVSQKTLLLRKLRSFYSVKSFYEQWKKGQPHDLIGEVTFRQVEVNRGIAGDVFRYRPKVLERDTDLTR